ncbi:hypothetical protein MIZ03_0851 [Rhodoferax lithotrophicus]|uniref:Uncharacterized protein n=1 Tax=Rhodoferax lithotrophicus TaxID=2798804 RepID=A0ABM7MIF9_9BURK|nr:hypothetical protein MIZ03_0851 [Rhodoferax sp. MIZ03]
MLLTIGLKMRRHFEVWRIADPDALPAACLSAFNRGIQNER